MAKSIVPEWFISREPAEVIVRAPEVVASVFEEPVSVILPVLNTSTLLFASVIIAELAVSVPAV